MTSTHTHKTTLWLDGEECPATVTYWLHEKDEFEQMTPADRHWVEVGTIVLHPTVKVLEFLGNEILGATSRRTGNQEALAITREMLKRASKPKRAA